MSLFNSDRLVQDLKDRFTTWETVLGAMFLLMACFIYLFPQYLVNLAIPGILLFIGFKWLFENKYRDAAKAEDKTNKYRK